MHTPMEGSLFQIIACYHQYAAREGDVETLSLEELKALLMDNVPHFMESLHFPQATQAQCHKQFLGRCHSVQTSDPPPWFPCNSPGDARHEGQGRKEPYYLSELFRAADKNKDKQISFEEFLFVLGRLLTDYHLLYHRRLCACYCAQHSLH
ncbi:protein S100-A15A [Mustela putorius furo]|uniref:Protein S100-A15A n=1 Tax=Mustela putorius furo TaxID=9669 RepID=A0A8U0V7L5_MUSPF|nr:protein S100-A15A [Mustela putorius furo]